MDTPHAFYKAIICVDIERFTDSGRIDPHRMDMRNALYQALETAFTRSGIPWGKCYREDRGDGAFFLVHPDVPKAHLVEPLPFALAAELGRHNQGADPETRIRLRVAIHAGDVYIESKGVVGAPLNLAFRLLDAPEFKEALRRARGDLVFITSDGFYKEVVRQRRSADPAAYREKWVTIRDTKVKAWICTSDGQLQAGQRYGEQVPRIETALAAVHASLEEARRDRDETAKKIIFPVPDVPDLDDVLRRRLAALKAPPGKGRWSELAAEVKALEHAARAALEEARAAHHDVRKPLDRREELRGLLTSYQAMAGKQGRVEDPHLSELYRQAHEQLWTAPCDLRKTEAATMRYVRAVQEETHS